MLYHLVHLEEPVYRPPSEAESLILQATIGCTWNRCSFCDMYTSKKFRVRPLPELQAEVERVARSGYPVSKVFLADGDAMALSTRRLLPVLELIRTKLTSVRRISIYASARNLVHKSIDELRELRDAGLELAYVGIESGDDEVLARIDKGETEASTIEGLGRAGEAGIKRSVMIINGLGGKTHWRQHATASARVLNAIQPEYASVLALMLPRGDARFQHKWGGGFDPLDAIELLQELRLLLNTTELERTIFRSDHASNYLVLKGTLGREKQRMLAQIDAALADPKHARLRPEWSRAL
jgi:radical SAM superfamily enzyme YgiQ (UPF0313 family)